jgi:predicted AAA+ superfamily ATPase
MRDAFDYTPELFAYYGGYPGAADMIKDEKRWRDYINNSLIETTVSRDVLQMATINKPKLLRNLFQLGGQYSSQVLSFTKIMGQLQDAGNTVTLSHYLELLGSAGLLVGLEKYSTNQLKVRSSSPKFQVYNNALLTAQSQMTYKDFQTEPKVRGRVVESAIGTHLLAAATDNYKVQYWKDSNYEVDYIITNGKKTIAIEVKTLSLTKHSGMERFDKLHKPDKKLLINDGGISWQEFLEIDPNLLFQ